MGIDFLWSQEFEKMQRLHKLETLSDWKLKDDKSIIEIYQLGGK